ncbi:RNA polymerase sigma-70 factor (ECF subfamily) [Friedmanniella endophytica]|uniref:RNA polymerase sigma-70 factor (ECF subfamily) n=1 Tax=Microlunatus kandeliicorticis TaxID=1759536 RepID=A0A7W3IPF4_9ACTN|nr:ECF RNA polymerase sigma factor SigK [Microlunatus kandeliicorticis]MBA8792770.1 RNA polymerase sigma-70 factor (ECF subfamily) [Microlunatus kandeliicorticis]
MDGAVHGGDDPASAGSSELPEDRPERGNDQLAALLAAAAEGDQQAFAELYDRTSARVHGVALRVLRSPDHAAEVTQEVFVDVWRQATRYSAGRGSVLAWITTMAHRRAVDRVRSVTSETARDVKYAEHTVEVAHDEVWAGVDQRLDVERVREGMAQLTSIQREALTLAYFGGYSQSQVAEHLGVPLGTVKTRIRDGLSGLRSVLGVNA